VCECELRGFVNVERKLARDLIWLIWDVLFYYMKERQSPIIEKVMGSLLTLFSLHYTNACCRKRRYILYFAVSLCTEQIATSTELVSDMRVVELAVKNINSIYKTIKKTEETPKTDYLFSGLDKRTSAAKSVSQINAVNSVIISGPK
jgi:predicted metal-dependent HD superfamily phosphohydrolase